MSPRANAGVEERRGCHLFRCIRCSDVRSIISLALLFWILVVTALHGGGVNTGALSQTNECSSSPASTSTSTSEGHHLVKHIQNSTASSRVPVLEPTTRRQVKLDGKAIGGNYDKASSTTPPLPGDPGQADTCSSRNHNPAGETIPAGETMGYCRERKMTPFFGIGGEDNQYNNWSYLNRKLEEYREDLVKVVKSLDMIINNLERTAAEVNVAPGRNMPGEGMRCLAAKLKRKLDKTPPRWQVNIDVLTWLLRPVPFVAGLPAPFSPTITPFPVEICDGDSSGVNNDVHSARSADTVDTTDTMDGVVAPGGGWFDASPTDEVVQPSVNQAGKDFPGCDGVGESPSVLGSAAVEEKRAVPVPTPKSQGPGGGTAEGREWKEGSKLGPGFYSYDDTHQIFIHILRDWTSEGDSVRAAVYDPILRALDEHFGAEGEATATNGGGGRSCGVGVDNRGRRNPGSGTANESRGDASGTCRPSGTWEGGGREDQPKPKASRCRSSSADRPRVAKVLVPGAGLGRLAVEIAARGYASVHANELSVTMLSSCYWLMEALRVADFTGTQTGSATPASGGEEEDGDDGSRSPPPETNGIPEHDVHMNDRDGSSYQGRDGCGDDRGSGGTGAEGDDGEESARGGEKEGATRGFFKFYPFLNDIPHNEIDGEARFRSVLFPDPEARTLLARASGRLSFQAGEFSATYGGLGGPYEGTFDAVVTSFFVDTAPDVVQYVSTIRRALRSGGLWINCGPLHWHNSAALTLSLDEMLLLVTGSGFRLEVVKQLPPSGYRVEDGGGSLRVEEFRPIFWVAVVEESEAS